MSQGNPKPRFDSIHPALQWESRSQGRTLAGRGTSAEVSLGREGVCWVSAPQDKQQDPNAPLFSRRGTVRRCYTQPGACAGVQNFLPLCPRCWLMLSG